MTSRSTAVADELADSVDRLHRLLDAASFEFAEFRSSRAALAEQISSFVGGLHAAVGQHDAALPEPPASSTPWQQVPAGRRAPDRRRRLERSLAGVAA